MTFVESIQLTCPAKVNLALSVGAINEWGMHPIASWMATTMFGDSMRVSRADETAFDIAFVDDAPKKQEIDWPLEKDLTYRAYRLMEENTGRTMNTSVTIRKRIPAGAGLGGGSSNAAGMMVAMNRLFGLKIPRDQLMEWSAPLGSDIAFLIGALEGQSSAIVSGIGESITPAPLMEPIHLVLIFPPFGCATAPVYKTFDEIRGDETKVADFDRVAALTVINPLPTDGPFNDLAEPAGKVEPKLHALRQTAQDVLHQPVHITGSGSTMFVIFPTLEETQSAAEVVTAKTDLPAVATRTM